MEHVQITPVPFLHGHLRPDTDRTPVRFTTACARHHERLKHGNQRKYSGEDADRCSECESDGIPVVLFVLRSVVVLDQIQQTPEETVRRVPVSRARATDS